MDIERRKTKVRSKAWKASKRQSRYQIIYVQCLKAGKARVIDWPHGRHLRFAGAGRTAKHHSPSQNCRLAAIIRSDLSFTRVHKDTSLPDHLTRGPLVR